MKVKILMMPLFVVATVAILIWFVYPAYTNGVDGLKEKNAILKTEQEKLANLIEKKANAETLSNQLSSLEGKEVLYDFLPKSFAEEEIVDNMNFNAIGSSLLMYSIAIKEVKKDNLAVVVNDDPDAGDSLAEADSQSLPKNEELGVMVALTGGYEQIKNFILAQEKNPRYNEFSAISITRSQSTTEGAPDALAANVAVNFQALKDTKLSVSTAGNSVFQKNVLDNSIISKIQERRNAPKLELNVDQKGKANPFAL